jgi:hypothetical protein
MYETYNCSYLKLWKTKMILLSSNQILANMTVDSFLRKKFNIQLIIYFKQ